MKPSNIIAIILITLLLGTYFIQKKEFVRLSQNYVSDGKHVYRLSSVTPEGFSVIGDDLVRDKYSMYWQGIVLPLDQRSIQYIRVGEQIVAAYDKYSLYLLTWPRAVKVEGAATSTFKFLEKGHYALDQNRVYHINYDYENTKVNIIKEADPQTFESIGVCEAIERSFAYYAKDKNHIYVEGEVVQDADPASFIYLGRYAPSDGEIPAAFSWAKDKDTIFYNCGEVLKDVDYETFEYLGNGRAQDKVYTYTLGEFSSFRKKR